MACLLGKKTSRFNRAEYYRMTEEKINTILLDSLQRGDLRMAKQIIDNCQENVNLDRLDEDGNCLLHKAISKEHLETVRLLVRAGAGLHIADSKGWTALHVSAAGSNLKLTKYLLEQGADVMKYTAQGDLPLDVAATLDAAMVLVEKMVSQGYKDLVNDYLMPLKVSNKFKEQSTESLTGQSFINSIQRLGKDEKSFEKLQDGDGQSQVGCRFRLSNADECSEKGRVTDDISDENSEAEMTQTRRYTFPSAAGPAKPIGSILKRSRSVDGYSNVRKSCGNDDQQNQMRITEKKTTSRAVTFPSDILCQVCIMDNDYNDLRRLILTDKISEIDKLYANGISALHLASIEDRPKCADVLIDCGANINNIDPNGWTPLHAAVVAGNIRCVKVLCNRGADLCATTNNGETVFDLAETDLIRKYLKMMTIRLVMGQTTQDIRRVNSY